MNRKITQINRPTGIRLTSQSGLTGLLPALVLGLCASVPAHATQAPTGDGLWYYEIGGAEPISSAPNPDVKSITLGGSARLGLGYSCGKFDPVIAATNVLNDIKSGADSMVNAMTTAATSAIASLPALILQRANPGLYDLFQNALLKAEATVDVATQSCEQMEAEIAQGKNPYADLITLSKGHDWKVAMGLPGSDVVRAKQQVEQANGSNGVPWIGGQAGGQHQAPLRFTGDIVAAGYNLHLNRPLTATDPVPVTDTTRLGTIWASPQAARDWAVDVVGENIATTCDTCRKDSIPGSGLLPKLHEESDTVAAQLQRLIDGTAPPTLDELDRVSAPGVAITRQVVEAIRDMPNTEQPLIMHRLVAEISAARTIEKALYARRLLLTGRQVPEVYATTVAREHAEAAVTELDREIDNLLFETRVRREVVSDTVAVLLQRAAARRQSSLQVPQVSPVDPRPLNRGRVQ